METEEQLLTDTGWQRLHRSYTYDPAWRLTREVIQQPLRLPITLDYTYDAVGNRLSRLTTGATRPDSTATYDVDDGLSSDEYDPNGNTLLGRSAFGELVATAFNSRNQLIHATLPLEEARAAHEMLEAGEVFGKVVLKP